MKIYIDYDAHPDLGSLQQTWKVTDAGKTAKIVHWTELMSKKIVCIERDSAHLILTLED